MNLLFSVIKCLILLLSFRTCPVFELFMAYYAKELALFICLLDFPEAKQLDRGFFRTKTLAKGDDICNFHYKKREKVVQGWDTEVEKILLFNTTPIMTTYNTSSLELN